MSNRLEKQPEGAKNSLRQGSLLSLSDQRLLAGLASAESRIIGSAQLGKMRDVAIGLLRVTTLLAAVLLPALSDSSPEQALPIQVLSVEAPEPRIAVIPVYAEQSRAQQGEADPVTVNIKVENMGQVVQPDQVTRVELIEHRPLKVKTNGKVVLGSGPGSYWYRTELGIGDYFWALPDGEFSFRVADRPPCQNPAQGTCALLDFEFETQAASQKRIGRVPLPTGGSMQRAPADEIGNLGTVGCVERAGGTNILRCTYINDSGSLIVDVFASRQLAEPAAEGKTAFLVRWCKVSNPATDPECPPSLVEPD